MIFFSKLSWIQYVTRPSSPDSNLPTDNASVIPAYPSVVPYDTTKSHDDIPWLDGDVTLNNDDAIKSNDDTSKSNDDIIKSNDVIANTSDAVTS